MRLHGHLVEVDWDGAVLVAWGTNADGRALVAAGSDDNRLVLAPADIADVVFRDAPRLVGGVLRVVDSSGAEHRLHFRRDTRPEFHRLYEELADAVAAARPEPEQGAPTEDEPAVVVDLTSPVASRPEQSGPCARDDAVHV